MGPVVIVFAVIGFFFGGFFGAIIGAIIGMFVFVLNEHSFDFDSDSDSDKSYRSHRSKKYSSSHSQDYSNNINSTSSSGIKDRTGFSGNNHDIKSSIIAFNSKYNITLTSSDVERLVSIYNFLEKKNIKYLYHFTDSANIPSIMQHGGLYSKAILAQKNIPIPKSAADATSRWLDQRYGLENYIRLSFCRNHPMMFVAKKAGRIDDPVILKIDPLIACLKFTKFSNMNATKTGHQVGNTAEFLNTIPFNIFNQSYFDLTEEEKSYYQAEILVPLFIKTEDIVIIKNHFY